ncbi:hypothetical protein LLB_1524 [Legionella longbeachae D-4968]|nr:hypothetical protein LLB_1524 [Legionella longbeachae D-4968]
MNLFHQASHVFFGQCGNLFGVSAAHYNDLDLIVNFKFLKETFGF